MKVVFFCEPFRVESQPGHSRLAMAQESRSPKAGHNKAGRSDFRNQRFEPDTGKMRKMRKLPLTLEKQGSEEIPRNKKRGKRGKCGKLRKRKRGKCGKCGWLALMWLALGDPQGVRAQSLTGMLASKGLLYFGESQKGTAERGWEKKRHDNLGRHVCRTKLPPKNF